MSLHLDSDGIDLRSHLASPATPTSRGLVLCHGFPQAPREAASAGLRYGEMADRIADQIGLSVLTFNLRGTGQSEGDFSLAGWCNDLRSAIAALRNEGVPDISLLGVGTGASIAIAVAAEDEAVRGVLALAPRSDFDDWAEQAPRLLEHARAFGMIRSDDFPADVEGWAQEFRDVRPIDVIDKIPPRPLLIIHGAEDERVPVADARQLVEAAGGNADLRVISGAGHRLRHDPRVVALMLGWLEALR